VKEIIESGRKERRKRVVRKNMEKRKW